MNGFKYSILSSGSDGNSLYIESAKEKLLIDAGLSGKKITNLLDSIDRDVADLTGILVTHEHRDHIQGVGVLARRYNIPIYANRPTWEAILPIIKDVDLELKNEFPMGMTKTIGDLDIESFGVSHDAVMPQFYRIHKNNYQFVVLTDTGYCSDRLIDNLKNADSYLIEMNHDIEMLRIGQKYSWDLKQRILSDSGHLSNEAGADAAVELSGTNTKRVYLGHRSQENNLKDLAHKVMEQTLKEADIDINNQIQIYDTYVEQALPLVAIDENK